MPEEFWDDEDLFDEDGEDDMLIIEELEDGDIDEDFE